MSDILEHPDIEKLFKRFLRRLDKKTKEDRTHRIMERVSPKHFKAIFDPPEMGDDVVLASRLEYCKDQGWIFLEFEKKFAPTLSRKWHRCQIIFNTQMEDFLRTLLNHPRVSHKEKKFRQAADKWKNHFARPDLLTPDHSFSQLGKSPEEIISRLAKIPEMLKKRPLSAYQLGAKLFWGCSKIFQGKERWLMDLFNLNENQLKVRPVIIDVSFPSKTPQGLLMVENLDSYFSACDGNWPDCGDLIKVYLQGFKGAAGRIRDEAMVRFHLSDHTIYDMESFHHFKKCWTGSAPFPYPIYFIGDLDYSGLQIFKYLKERFPELLPWKRGYEIMIGEGKKDNSHTPSMARKENQHEIIETDDSWLDENALSFIKEKGLFVDQEVIG